MDFLGIGPFELLMIFLLALILFGPNDMVKAGRTLGQLLRKVVTHPTWQVIQQTSRDFRTLPNKLIREAGLENEVQKLQEMKGDVEGLKNVSADLTLNSIDQDLKKTSKDISAWITPPTIGSPPPPKIEEAQDSSETPPKPDNKGEE